MLSKIIVMVVPKSDQIGVFQAIRYKLHKLNLKFQTYLLIAVPTTYCYWSRANPVIARQPHDAC